MKEKENHQEMVLVHRADSVAARLVPTWGACGWHVDRSPTVWVCCRNLKLEAKQELHVATVAIEGMLESLSWNATLLRVPGVPQGTSRKRYGAPRQFGDKPGWVFSKSGK